VQSPPTDLFFTNKFLTESLLGNREYLFDQVPALMAIFDNVIPNDNAYQHEQEWWRSRRRIAWGSISG
jgi:hypothetical protein